MGSAIQQCNTDQERITDIKTEALKIEQNSKDGEIYLSPVRTGRGYQSEKAEIKRLSPTLIDDREFMSSSPVRRPLNVTQKYEMPNSIVSVSSNTISGGAKKQFPDGSCYIGECNAKGIPHGKGRFTSSKGDIYIGEFENGKIQGQGMLTDSEGNVYTGTFEKSLRHGKGVEKMSCGDLYEGQFSEDKRHGYGRLSFI